MDRAGLWAVFEKGLNGENIGPMLLEDPIAREKIMLFDHERIPERVVYIRGTGTQDWRSRPKVRHMDLDLNQRNSDFHQRGD